MSGISDAQRAALATLAPVVDPSTYLGGGVAVALRLDHRQSRDLDLFVLASDPVAIAPALEQPGIRILTRAEGTLHLEVSGVPASIMRYGYPLLQPPERLPGIPVLVASLADLVCMKLSAIAGRGARRDFWDLHALLTSRKQSLREALDTFGQKYTAEDVGHVVRSLVYFADAEAEPMLTRLTGEHWEKIKADLRDWVCGL
jgi:Nucleotidyl transferase AbiEii toxin, Type IV TA system